MDEEITATRRHLDALLAERRLLKSQQNQKHDPYILRLPTELSSKIFMHCLQLRQPKALNKKGLKWYDDKHSRGSRPSEIATVCRAWRAIALSTPGLWTRIHVTLRGVDANGWPDYLDFMNDLVSRSGALPLSFSVKSDVGSRAHGDFAQDDYLPLIDLLNQNSARWDIVHIAMRPKDIPLLDGCGAPSTVLSTLLIDCPNRQFTPHSLPFRLKGNPPSPLLVNSTGFSPSSLHLDWSRATTVTLRSENIFLDHFFRLLSASPQLETLCISISELLEDGIVPDVEQPRMHIICPNLENLEILAADTLSFISTFERLTLPGLRYLRLRHFEDIDGLADFVSRSSCGLSTLQLDYLDDHPSTFDELTRSTGLRRLELHHSLTDTEALTLLRRFAETQVVDINSESAPLLPELECLCLTGIFSEPVMNWSLIPAIFPPADVQLAPGTKIRPFKDLMLTSSAWISNFDDPNVNYIPQEDIIAFEDIISRGFSLKVWNEDSDDEPDFILLSRQFHDRLASS